VLAAKTPRAAADRLFISRTYQEILLGGFPCQTH
jgi:hypothetical protein